MSIQFLNFVPKPANRNDCYEKLKHCCNRCYDYGRIAVIKDNNAVREKYCGADNAEPKGDGGNPLGGLDAEILFEKK